jgi:hypothetical protein
MKLYWFERMYKCKSVFLAFVRNTTKIKVAALVNVVSANAFLHVQQGFTIIHNCIYTYLGFYPGVFFWGGGTYTSVYTYV